MTDIVFVAVRPTADQEPERPPRERVQAQSRSARVALAEAAGSAGCGELSFEKDADDVPLPTEGWHWSVSHDAHLVAGAVTRGAVGVDLERAELRRVVDHESVLDSAERGILGPVDALAFARLWTAKEAVLKAAGVGLGELSACRLAEPLGEDWVRLLHHGRPCLVRQAFPGGHVIAVHTPGEDWTVAWDLAGA